MDEALAIRLIRLLIGEYHNRKPREIGGITIPQSTQDFSCPIHAIVASLTFAMFGVKTRIAKGRASVFAPRAMMPILNHRFVVRESDNAIFDSSIEFPVAGFENQDLNFRGIAFGRCPDFPNLEIIYSRKNPGSLGIAELNGRAQKRPILQYVEDSADSPEDLLEMKLASGSCADWIQATFGSQFGIAPRFALVVAEELKAAPPNVCLNREELIQKVQNTSPDTIHKFRTICRKLR